MNNKTTIEAVLKEKGEYIVTPVGTSMWPMIRNRTDTFYVVTTTERLKKYDVPLYRRKNGQYVMHRILEVRPTSYVLCGDNQWQREYGVTDGDILAVTKGFYKGERYIPCTSRGYRLYCRLWCLCLPLRHALLWAVHQLYRIKLKVKK